jgi:hypothetical protein
MSQEKLPQHEQHEQDAQTSDEVSKLSTEALLRAMLSGEKEKPEVFGDEDDEFVKWLKGIKQFLGINGDISVIYPGSSTHVGVARVFGKGNVTHVDPNSDAVEVLTNNGYGAIESTIEDYRPAELADGVVALNSYGAPSAELIDKLVKPGGFVIANNHTHWAAELAKLGDTLKLVGAVMPDYRLPNAKAVGSSEVPEGATDLVKQYYIFEPDGSFKPGTPGNHTFEDESPKYPDALFVFKRS